MYIPFEVHLVIILILIGLFALYSASIASNLEAFKKQIMWVLIGLPMLIGLMFIDYKLIARFSIVFYIISLISTNSGHCTINLCISIMSGLGISITD